jgi:hypothetical protein
MSVRIYLARRARLAAAFLWLDAVLLIVLSVRGFPQPEWVALLFVAVLALGLVALRWSIYAVRCPFCTVRYGVIRWSCFTSSRRSERFNSCPGCGTPVDSQLPVGQ